MAESKNNIITHGLSGKVGDLLVFSQRHGKTVVSQKPKESTKPPSEKQKQRQSKFQHAVVYAKTAVKDPITKDLYEEKAKTKPGLSSYNVAVADLINAPKIEKIDLSNYDGTIGSTIGIVATDDFMVASVKVTIQNSDGTLVEEGLAKETAGVWIFTAKATNADLSGDKITIEASDLPDNVATETKTL